MEQVKDWRSEPRVSKLDIADAPTTCVKTECMFTCGGVCPSPRKNKKEKKAKCHYLTNKKLLELLTPQ